eukprot:COSAG04_NODE_94_length_26569_cov_27.995127_15_plen_355_part_00
MGSSASAEAASGPASYTFKDLQSLQELGPASLKVRPARPASRPATRCARRPSDAACVQDARAAGGVESLQFNQGEGLAGGYGEMPGSSPMFKFGSPSPPSGQVKSEYDQWQLPHTGLTPTAAAAQGGVPGASGAAAMGPGVAGAAGGAHPQAAGGFGQMGGGAAAAAAGARQPRRKRNATAPPEEAPATDKRKYTHEEAMAILNKKGGPVSEEDLARIDPASLSQEDVRKLKKMRRAIRNRESATASRLRRKEYIENLEKRMSDLSSQNTLLNISVTEMQMREKEKRDEEERIRLENERLRADTESTRLANAKLREEKLYMQQVSEKLQAFKISQAGSAEATIPDDTVVEPPTW